MVPVLVLAVIAVGVIKTLMGVVARDEAAGIGDGAGIRSATADFSTAQAYDPTMQLRSRVHDDARGFLLPAAPDPADVADITDGAGANGDNSAGVADHTGQLG